MTSLEINPVRGRKDWRDFLRLPWTVYQNDPLWVPPIRSEVARLLDPGRHPFWHNARREVFLARREGRAVGRVVALVDERNNQIHAEQAGVWGFFECLPDPEAAQGLFLAAENWLRGQGMVFMRGPLNPSLNYEVGLLVAGFDTSPALMMTYNPPYYLDLVMGCGHRKEKDLLSFRFGKDYEAPAWTQELAKVMESRPEVSVLHPDRRRLKEELLEANRLFAESWRDNWGFVPMTDAEFLESARGMMAILDPDLAFFLCYQGQKVGVCLCLPDVSPLLKRLNGSLGLSALLKKHLYWSEINGIRGLLLGLKEEYRQMGLQMLAMGEMLRQMARKPQYEYLEAGWNLEDNQAINLSYLEDGGKAPDKRYRIFRKPL